MIVCNRRRSQPPLFIISPPELVIAQSISGIGGSFPSINARPVSELRLWHSRITEALAAHDAEHPDSPAAPFAVNVIVHKSNDRFEEDLALVEEFRVPVVITSLGARPDLNERIHAYGGIVLLDVDNLFAFADNGFDATYFAPRKEQETRSDGLVAVVTNRPL